eukprot:TRINITY_DN1307_c0_g2_i1.p1 TRINITY_DN1307_c0_g2~~TRINITY_DN1307_c0_g2_i1.p1  ORF type:complete len:901 (+),score=234.58 TRINITY_DN1307_c0_g2_i1:125-2827(+)
MSQRNRQSETQLQRHHLPAVVLHHQRLQLFLQRQQQKQSKHRHQFRRPTSQQQDPNIRETPMQTQDLRLKCTRKRRPFLQLRLSDKLPLRLFTRTRKKASGVAASASPAKGATSKPVYTPPTKATVAAAAAAVASMDSDTTAGPAPGPEEEVKEDEIPFKKCIEMILKDDDNRMKELEANMEEVREIRKKIVVTSKSNFILEKELLDLDEKIKRLIKNLITVQEVVAGSQVLDRSRAEASGNPLKSNRRHYENMFWILQNEPRYFAKLAPVVTGKDISPFVQLAVFDLFGDQYDTREERLLLALFGSLLQDEFERTSDMGSFLRANTAVSQMLSAYARRGIGMTILKSTLGPPLEELMRNKDLDLELIPDKVYTKMIIDFETKTGTEWPKKKDVTPEELENDEDVQRELKRRMDNLSNFATKFLDSILDNADKIPYGMRWICKQVKILAEQSFPDADRYQIASLIGGYVCLRFFSPAIVTPDALNIITDKPNKLMRRNLVLVAKCLQNLSNGQYWGEHKAEYMIPLNSFIDKNRSRLTDYLLNLANVDDLEYRLNVDRLLALTNTRNSIVSTTMNQVFLIHDLLLRHLDRACPGSSDPMREILQSLGAAPPQVPVSENHPVAVELVEKAKFDKRLTEAPHPDLEASSLLMVQSPVFSNAKKLIQQVLKAMPKSIYESSSSLDDFLERAKQYAREKKNLVVVEHISNVESMLVTMSSFQSKESNRMKTSERFFSSMVEQAKDRQEALDDIQKKKKLVKNAFKIIEDHSTYLEGQLDYYRTYLDNVRKGQAQDFGNSKEYDQVYKVSHPKLEEMKVIEWVDPNVSKTLKKCSYKFTHVGPNTFRVEVYLKKGLKFNDFSQEVKLDDLLQMKDNLQTTVEMGDYLRLNVNLLIHLLNREFIAN